MSKTDEILYSELKLLLVDEGSPEFGELFAKAEDAVNGYMTAQEMKLLLSEVLELAESRLDLLQGDVQQGEWAWGQDGWAKVARDLDGNLLSVKVDGTAICLEYRFFKGD